MKTVTLYTRAGCHLCDAARERLERARERAVFRLEVVDIDGDASLRERYNEDVPVVAVDGRELFRYLVDVEEFLERVRA